MPNWCDCDLTISGDIKQLKQFAEGIKEKSILQSYHPCSTGWDYDWCVRNWGTKWTESRLRLAIRKNTLICHFRTAWEPPLEGLLEISKKFPTLKFQLKGYGCGMAYKITWKAQTGVVLKYDTEEYLGPREG